MGKYLHFIGYSKANIYGINVSDIPNLNSQFAYYRRLLDENEKNKLKRTFANIEVDDEVVMDTQE